MRLLTKSILVAGSALALAGGALAAERSVHVLNVRLPDGSIERIRYVGDKPPAIALVPVVVRPVAMADPFAQFDRMFAEMRQRNALMMRQAAAMQRAALAGAPVTANGQVNMAALKALPGTVRYSFVSTSTGNGTCTRSVQMTSFGPNQLPKIVSSNSGDCGAMAKPLTPAAATPATPPAKAPFAPKPLARDLT